MSAIANGGTFYCCGSIAGGGSSASGVLKPWLYDYENEVVIGVYDGKPLYRKMFRMYITCNANDFYYYSLSDYMENIDDVEKIVHYSGYILQSIVPKIFAPNSGITDYNISLLVEAKTIIISTGSQITLSNEPCDVMLEYTKTTDAEGSGNNLTLSSGSGGSSNSSLINYSLEEQVVGTWIDGRPIYQKTFKYDSSYVTNWGGNNNFPLLIDSGNIVNYQLLLFMNDGVTVCESWTIQNEIHCINVNTDRIVLFITSNFQSYFDELCITVQYIKTTD